MGMLSPVIATLLADTKEYMAKMNEADEKMHKFGKTAEESGGKFHKFANTASNAVIGVGAAITGYAIDQALKFNEVLDNIQNQSGASAEEVDRLKTSIINVSNETAISSDKIGNAFLQVEKAGIRGASAYKLVDAAAKTGAQFQCVAMFGLHTYGDTLDSWEEGEGRAVIGMSAGIRFGGNLLSHGDVCCKLGLLRRDGTFCNQFL